MATGVTIELPIPAEYIPVLQEIFVDMDGIKTRLYDFLREKVIAHELKDFVENAKDQMDSDIIAEKQRLIELYGGEE